LLPYGIQLKSQASCTTGVLVGGKPLFMVGNFSGNSASAVRSALSGTLPVDEQ
jgi:hypothetical protein